MSALRQRLKRPDTYLAALALLAAALVTDSFLPPRAQLTARVYIAAVESYRHRISPLLKGTIMCRYRPSCSQYSIEAVRRFGIRRGLLLSWRRVNSCRRTVPLETPDPVPNR